MSKTNMRTASPHIGDYRDKDGNRIDPVKVPPHLQNLYALQSAEVPRFRGTEEHDWSTKLSNAETGYRFGYLNDYPIVERAAQIMQHERDYLDNFVVHSLKLTAAQHEYDRPQREAQEAKDKADSDDRNRCQVCSEVTGWHVNVMDSRFNKSTCPACVAVADAIYVEAHRTKAREHAVRSAWL